MSRFLKVLFLGLAVILSMRVEAEEQETHKMSIARKKKDKKTPPLHFNELIGTLPPPVGVCVSGLTFWRATANKSQVITTCGTRRFKLTPPVLELSVGKICKGQ